jgi:CBS domain-containing protein
VGKNLMKIERICNPGLVSADPTDTLFEAARKMARNHVGALAVMDQGKLVGVIGESDIVAAVAEDAVLDTTLVEEYMTEDAITVEVGDDVESAAHRMLVHRVHHLPVMEAGSAVGMISSGDLLAVGLPARRTDIRPTELPRGLPST